MIKDLITKKQFKKAYEELRKLHPHDQAEFIETLDVMDQARLLSHMTDAELSELLTYLDAEHSAYLITELDIARQKSILDQMDIDDAVDILEELEEEEQTAILKVLDDQDDYVRLLEYDEDESGSLMTSNYIQISSDLDVKDAMKILIKRAPDVENITTLFVTDDKKHYQGVVNLNQLIKAKTPQKVEALLVKSPYINATDDIDMAIHTMREYGLYEMAVCDEEKRLIGIITLDDAIEAYSEEATEDFAKLAAVNELEEKSIFKAALHRLPWLLILLLSSIPIAMATSMFEEVILSVSILALFQPLILDASGDVATQTLAVTLRKLNQTDGSSIKEGIKEVITGAINGVILGLASAIITYFLAVFFKMDQPLMVALVVGLSLLITVIIGPILGFLIPVGLNKINVDPAVASGPFITTLVDIISLVVYFGLATIMLGVI